MNIQTELSIRGNSPPPIGSPNSSDHEPISPQQQQQFSRNSSSCFKCQKSGHWARDCPEKSKSPFKSVPANRVSTAADGVPQLPCRCGAGFCKVLVSNTARNPNRKFYTCPDNSNSCGMFKWCDKVTVDEINNPRQYRFPECGCGSGRCNLVKLQDGPNAGRDSFVCPIQKGYGACSFYQLFDHTRDIIINGEVRSEDINSPGHIDIYPESDVEDGGVLSAKYFKKRDLDSPVNSNPRNTLSPVAISEPWKRSKPASSLPKPYDPLLEGFASNASKSSFLASHADIHSRQIEFDRLLSSAGYTIVEENLQTQLSSSPAQKQQISTGDPCDGGGVEQTDIFKVKISSNVRNLLRNQLLAMDILDHDHMLELSNVAFESLNHLKVDYTTFPERVMEFISCASSLAAIEWSMHEEPSHQELVDRHAEERIQFDYISSCEAEAKTALRDSSDHLRSLREEASSLRNRLAEVENELLVREKEAKEHENRVAGISQKVSNSRLNLWEVEEAARRCEEMETKRMIAEAALDKARVQLRQC